MRRAVKKCVQEDKRFTCVKGHTANAPGDHYARLTSISVSVQLSSRLMDQISTMPEAWSVR